MQKLLILALLIVAACNARKPTADLIIKGGTIYTAEETQPTVEAVAVKGDSILFAGMAAEAEEYRGESTETLDLNGATMTPGFIESHGHIMGLGYSELNLDLM